MRPAAARQRMVSRTAFQKMASHQPGKSQNVLGTSHVPYRLGPPAPLFSHCLKGLQLSDNLTQVVLFTLVVQSDFPAKISVAGIACSSALWGMVTFPLGHNLLHLRAPHLLERATEEQSVLQGAAFCRSQLNEHCHAAALSCLQYLR